MWADLALTGMTSIMKAGVGFMQAQEEYESKKKWQAYNNAMTRIADANNQNAITTNESMAKARAANQDFQIDRTSYQTQGAAAASAAAADTGGRSVNAVMFDIQRNAAMQHHEVDQDLSMQITQMDQQRANSHFQMQSNLDYSALPRPNAATYALGIMSDITSGYARSLSPTK